MLFYILDCVGLDVFLDGNYQCFLGVGLYESCFILDFSLKDFFNIGVPEVTVAHDYDGPAVHAAQLFFQLDHFVFWRDLTDIKSTPIFFNNRLFVSFGISNYKRI